MPRIWLTLGLWWTVAVACHAQTVELKEVSLADQCFRVEMTLDLKGKISIQQDGKTVTFPQDAKASHEFFERVLETTNGLVDKSARHYLKAEGTIAFNNQATKRTLPKERAFMVAHQTKEGFVIYSPKSALNREEVELTEHFNTLAIPGLLPGKETKVGETWKLDNTTTLLLCDLDGLTGHDVTCKLESVEGEQAKLSIAGTASGIDFGAQVKMLINGSAIFNVKEKRIVEIEWKQSDQRDQGPVSPALAADVSVKLKRSPIAEPMELSKFALVPIPPGNAPANLTNFTHQDRKARYELTHSRDWHVVSPEGSDQLVLRLLERGDFVAQASVTPWKKIDPVNLPTLDQFHELVADTPGWAEESVQEKTKVDSPAGYTVYRVTASGKLENVKSVQSFYLIASPKGEQVVVTFSMVPAQVSKLGARDLTLVRSIVFPSSREEPILKTSATEK